MPKRTYNRRNEEEIIDALESKIKQIEKRMEARQRPDSPLLKEIPKVRRQLAKFAQLCMDHQRGDLSNSVLAFLATLESQARQVPDARRNASEVEI